MDDFSLRCIVVAQAGQAVLVESLLPGEEFFVGQGVAFARFRPGSAGRRAPR